MVTTRLQHGTALPTYAATREFTLRIPHRRGILKGLDFDWRGTTVGSSAVNMDSPERLIDNLEVTFAKKGGGEYRMAGAFRDFRLLAEMLNGAAPSRGASGAAAAQFSTVHLPLYFRQWVDKFDVGIDTDELEEMFEVKGRYAAALEYGADTTDFTAGALHCTPVVDQDEPHGVKRVAMLMQQRFVPLVSAAKVSDFIAKKDFHALAAILFRTRDFSATASDRVDGLFSRLEINHSEDGKLVDEFFVNTQQAGRLIYGGALAEVNAAAPAGHAGTCLWFPNPDGYLGKFPGLAGATVEVTFNASIAVPTGVTSVTPAASDGVMVSTVGLVFNQNMLEFLGRG